MQNVNVETGIRYGVINGNSVPELLEEIMMNGTDLNYKAVCLELHERIKKIIDSHDSTSKIRDELRSVADDYSFRADEIVDSLNVKSLDVDSLVEEILDDWQETYECEYHYKDGDFEYLTGMLGGAILIWTIKSRYAMQCRTCSPCVPGAGDLDTPSDVGEVAYCPHPDWLEDKCRQFIRFV